MRVDAEDIKAIAEHHRAHLVHVCAAAKDLIRWIEAGQTPSCDMRGISISDDMERVGTLLAFVRRVAEMDPEDAEGRSCIFCGGGLFGIAVTEDRNGTKHAPDCLWVIAQGAK